MHSPSKSSSSFPEQALGELLLSHALERLGMGPNGAPAWVLRMKAVPGSALWGVPPAGLSLRSSELELRFGLLQIGAGPAEEVTVQLRGRKRAVLQNMFTGRKEGIRGNERRQ